MPKSFLMGDEAIGLGAIRAGVQVVSGYPGAPSTEVLETMTGYNPRDIYTGWSVNKKAGMEVAAVAIYTGAGTVVTMKQVGLNVVLDPLTSLAYVGVKGDMVVVTANNPGSIFSQTRQDTRRFGQFSKLPVFDPSSPEEAYEMIKDAFEYFEKYHTPVLFRPTTRPCHGCASVELEERVELPEYEGFIKGSGRWVISPRLSHTDHGMIETRSPMMEEDFPSYRSNLLHREERNTVKDTLTHGISYEFVMEALNGYKGVRALKVSTPNPMPERLFLGFTKGLDEVMTMEELDPVLEREMLLLSNKHRLPLEVKGKLTREVQPTGENSVESVRRVLEVYLGESYIQYLKGLEDGAANPGASQSGASQPKVSLPVSSLSVRPPVLCVGYPHRASFYAVKRAMEKLNEGLAGGAKLIEGVYCGDIGCYTLGNARLLDMVDICLYMGARITMTQGLQRVEPDKRYFSFVGDSTFFVSDLTGIVNTVYNEASLTLCILDNSITTMAGHQPRPGTGWTMMGNVVEKADVTRVLEGIGVKNTITVDTLDLGACVEAVLKLSATKGVKAVIFKSPCVAVAKSSRECRVAKDSCVNCRTCISEISCPTLVLEEDVIHIDSGLCTRYGLCSQICSVNVIEMVK